MPRTSAHHRRVFAFLAEHLETRSVPSGLGPLSLFTLGSTVQSATNLVDDVGPSSNLGEPVVAPASSSPAPALAVGDVVATATGTVLGAVDSGLNLVAAPAASIVPPIDVALGSHATAAGTPDAHATETSTWQPVDVPGVVSLNAGVPPVVPGAGDISTGLVGAVDDVVDTLDGVVAGVVGGGGPADKAGGISIGGDSGLGDTGISISISTSTSNPAIASTLPGLSVDVDLPLSPSLALTVESTGQGPPSVPTNPAPSGGSTGVPTSPSQGGSPVTNPSTTPTAPGGSNGGPASPTSTAHPVETGGNSTSPPSGAGSNEIAPSGQGSLGSVNLPGASTAPSTGLTPDGATPGEGPAAEAASSAPNAGPVAIHAAAESVAAHGAASSTIGSSVSMTTPGPAAGVGDAAVAGRGRLEDSSVLKGPSSVGPERPSGTDIAPAELLPGDLEGLERALGQLMRRLDEVGENLADWVTEGGTVELLLEAGMVVLACEVIGRWERRRRLANPRVQIGSSSRPGPFYRPMTYPFGRTGPGTLAGGSAIV
jgi:hypothetical protein